MEAEHAIISLLDRAEKDTASRVHDNDGRRAKSRGNLAGPPFDQERL